MMRKLKAKEIDFDAKRDCFIYLEDGKEFQLPGENEGDDVDSDDIEGAKDDSREENKDNAGDDSDY